ncbi:hypothetical protein KKG38_04030, partial [Patescibacteria group bacterium]|nr:hypothetical protein [Patescibacteria group bacterium]MBU1901218.1 hypothetical protein [Patescibacteria group bacterium]
SYQSQWEIYEQDDPNMIDRIFGKKAGFEIGNGLSIWSQENKAVDYALSHPVQTGTAIGVTSGALIVGGAKAATALSVRYLGSVGTMCLWSCDKINVGDSFGRLGTVINNASGHITGFNHNGTYHGIDQIISRGVSPEVILKTVQSPTLRFSARFGRIGYLSKDAYIVLDSSGQVVTAIAQSNFYGTLLQVSNMIK